MYRVWVHRLHRGLVQGGKPGILGLSRGELPDDGDEDECGALDADDVGVALRLPDPWDLVLGMERVGLADGEEPWRVVATRICNTFVATDDDDGDSMPVSVESFLAESQQEPPWDDLSDSTT